MTFEQWKDGVRSVREREAKDIAPVFNSDPMMVCPGCFIEVPHHEYPYHLHDHVLEKAAKP